MNYRQRLKKLAKALVPTRRPMVIRFVEHGTGRLFRRVGYTADPVTGEWIRVDERYPVDQP